MRRPSCRYCPSSTGVWSVVFGPDGTVEMHIVSYASDADRENYRNDPRRAALAWLLEKSSAKLELLPMANVS